VAETEGPVAIMCAEAVPWRCHRSLVADALVAHGDEVVDILGPGKSRPHVLTPSAVTAGTAVTYPGPPEAPDPGSPRRRARAAETPLD
jgi:hypothetical protein